MNIKPNFVCGTPGKLFTGTQIANAKNVLDEVLDERKSQHFKWGEQTHSPESWLTVLVEEVGEVAHAINEGYVLGYREELIQTAAVCVAMVESLDRQRLEELRCQNESSK